MRQTTFSHTALLVSTLLSAILLPVAHGQTVENLVFTEVSPTQLTESLNGAALGSWSYAGGTEFLDSSTYGIVSGQPPLGNSQTAFLQFADPANPGNEAFVSLPVDGVKGGQVIINVTPIAAVILENETFPEPGIMSPNLTPSMPYSESGASVSTPGGPVDVNITFVAAPDHAPTIGLMLIAACGLFITRKQCRPA